MLCESISISRNLIWNRKLGFFYRSDAGNRQISISAWSGQLTCVYCRKLVGMDQSDLGLCVFGSGGCFSVCLIYPLSPALPPASAVCLVWLRVTSAELWPAASGHTSQSSGFVLPTPFSSTALSLRIYAVCFVVGDWIGCMEWFPAFIHEMACVCVA